MVMDMLKWTELILGGILCPSGELVKGQLPPDSLHLETKNDIL
jgi:hypothetical protein